MINTRQFGVDGWWLARVLVGAVIGLSLGTLIAADPVALPILGAVNGVVVGGLGLAVGGALYTRLPDCGCGSASASDSGCADECGC